MEEYCRALLRSMHGAREEGKQLVLLVLPFFAPYSFSFAASVLPVSIFFACGLYTMPAAPAFAPQYCV